MQNKVSQLASCLLCPPPAPPAVLLATLERSPLLHSLPVYHISVVRAHAVAALQLLSIILREGGRGREAGGCSLWVGRGPAGLATAGSWEPGLTPPSLLPA